VPNIVKETALKLLREREIWVKIKIPIEAVTNGFKKVSNKVASWLRGKKNT